MVNFNAFSIENFCRKIQVGTLFFILIFFCIIKRLSAQSNSHNSLSVEKIRVDPNYAQGGQVSQIFDSVRYIPLETTKESLFGNIDGLQVSKHYFVFFDHSTKSLFIFDKKGKFHAKIDRLPMAGWYNEIDYLKISNSFVLNRQTEDIYIIYTDHSKENKKKLAVFNPEGKLIRDQYLPDIMLTLSDRFAFLRNGDQLFSNTFQIERNDTAKHYFYILHDFDSVVVALMPLRNDDPLLERAWDAGYHYNSDNGNTSVWNRSGDYSIIKMNTYGKASISRYIFPASLSIDSVYYRDSLAKRNFQSNYFFFNKHKDQIKSMDQIWSDGKIFSFAINKGNGSGNVDTYMQSLGSGSLFNFYRITPDSLSCFLPITMMGCDAIYNNRLYNAIPSYYMFSQNERGKQFWEKNAILKEYFNTQNRKSNSVIVELKPKENL